MTPPIGDVFAVRPDYTNFPGIVLERVPGSVLYGGKEGRPQIVFIPGGVEKIPDEGLRGAIKMAGTFVEKSVPEPHQKFDYPGRAGTDSQLPVRYGGSPEDLEALTGGGFVSLRLTTRVKRNLRRSGGLVPFYGSRMKARGIPYEKEARDPKGFYEEFFESDEFRNSQEEGASRGGGQFNSGLQEEKEKQEGSGYDSSEGTAEFLKDGFDRGLAGPIDEEDLIEPPEIAFDSLNRVSDTEATEAENFQDSLNRRQ